MKEKEIAKLFAEWLKPYTKEVIISVLERKNEIIANSFAMDLLRELQKREEKAHKEFESSIEFLLRDFDTFKQYDPHCCLEHPNSYRDVLFDMYISGRETA